MQKWYKNKGMKDVETKKYTIVFNAQTIIAWELYKADFEYEVDEETYKNIDKRFIK